MLSLLKFRQEVYNFSIYVYHGRVGTIIEATQYWLLKSVGTSVYLVSGILFELS